MRRTTRRDNDGWFGGMVLALVVLAGIAAADGDLRASLFGLVVAALIAGCWFMYRTGEGE